MQRLVFFFFLLALSNLSAQTPEQEFASVKNDFPKEDYVFLTYNTELQLAVIKGELKTTFIRESEAFCLNENDIRFKEGSFSYSSFSQLIDANALTLVPNGKGYRKVKVQDFKEYNLATGSVFYDDQTNVKFIWPESVTGAKNKLRIEQEINDPHFTPGFYLPIYSPTQKGNFTIKVEEGIELKYTPFNLDILDHEYSQEVKNGFTYHRWNFKNFKGLKYEGNAEYTTRFMPHILIKVKSFEGQNGRQTVFGDVSDLHNWYCQFLAQNADDDVENLKPIVDSLTQGASSQLEAAKRIYRWVQKNIKYVAFEDGYNGYKPAKASEVCNVRFGDCKGMSNLLHHMFEIYGLESDLTWVGTRSISYTYDEVPSPETDNHMILTAIINGHLYVLDPTHELLPITAPSPFIQGKQMLINKECDTFAIEVARIPSPEENILLDSSIVKLENQNLIGESVATLTGYSRMLFVQSINSSDYESLLKVGREYFSKGSNKFVLDTIWIDNLESIDEPLKIHYHFRIDDYCLPNGQEKYLNLNFDRNSEVTEVEEDDFLPKMLQFKTKVISHTEFLLGQSERIEELPANQMFEHNDFSYSIKYAQKDNIVKRDFEETFNFLEMNPENIDQWNEFVKSLSRSKRDNLIIYSK